MSRAKPRAPRVYNRPSGPYCEECDTHFSRNEALRSHMQNVHGAPGAVELHCEQCSFTTNYRNSLKTHIQRVRRSA